MTALSPFVHPFVVDHREYFYHSLTMDIHSSQALCPGAEHEAELLKLYREKALEDKGVVMGTIFITTRCPRECSYCFLAGVDAGDVTEGEIDRTMDIMGPGASDLLLYGGEPLLRQDLVGYAAERIRDKHRNINLILITGGVPVDPTVAKLLASLGAFIIISMDGPPGVNNLLRPLKNSMDSFEMAENCFHSFREAGCRVGISVTLASSSIMDARDSFLWLMDRFAPDDMGLNPWLHPLGRGIENPCQASFDNAFTAVTSCMEVALRRGMYVEQLARRARPFVNRSPRLKDCASSGGRLVVMPGGIAGTCDCMTCRGDHGVPLSDGKGIKKLMDSFRALAPVFFSNCLSCPALSICGGGCRYDAFRISGDLQGRWPERCRFERRFLHWMLEKTVRDGRESLVPAGGFREIAMPMPAGTMLGEDG